MIPEFMRESVAELYGQFDGVMDDSRFRGTVPGHDEMDPYRLDPTTRQAIALSRGAGRPPVCNCGTCKICKHRDYQQKKRDGTFVAQNKPVRTPPYGTVCAHTDGWYAHGAPKGMNRREKCRGCGKTRTVSGSIIRTSE